MPIFLSILHKTTCWRLQKSKLSLIPILLSFTPSFFFYSVDWNVDQPVTLPPPAFIEPKQLVTKPPTPPPTVTAIDSELEKRRKRAERFGIPFIEPKNPPTTDARLFPLLMMSLSHVELQAAKKLEERAARFGIPAGMPAPAPSNSKKNLKRPAAQADVVDPEELERRRKRAERFATVRTL